MNSNAFTTKLYAPIIQSVLSIFGSSPQLQRKVWPLSFAMQLTQTALEHFLGPCEEGEGKQILLVGAPSLIVWEHATRI